MKEVVLIFADTESLAGFLIETNLNAAQVCSKYCSATSVMKTKDIQLALSKYGALEYDVFKWERLKELQRDTNRESFRILHGPKLRVKR